MTVSRENNNHNMPVPEEIIKAMKNKPEKQNRAWSELDLNWLKANYKKFTYKEISRKLGRTELAIKGMTIAKGWAKPKPKWREDEICVLKDMYDRISVADLSKRLGKSKSSIICKANRLGIAKSR